MIVLDLPNVQTTPAAAATMQKAIDLHHLRATMREAMHHIERCATEANALHEAGVITWSLPDRLTIDCANWNARIASVSQRIDALKNGGAT